MSYAYYVNYIYDMNVQFQKLRYRIFRVFQRAGKTLDSCNKRLRNCMSIRLDSA